MNVWKWALVAVLSAGCTGDGGKDDTGADAGDDDDDNAAECMQVGTWSIEMTLEAGADPLCPEVDPDTLTVDGETSTTDDCDPDCECSLIEDGCSADLHQECSDGDTETVLDCDMQIDGDSLSGSCDISVDVISAGFSIDCAYTLSGEFQG